MLNSFTKSVKHGDLIRVEDILLPWLINLFLGKGIEEMSEKSVRTGTSLGDKEETDWGVLITEMGNELHGHANEFDNICDRMRLKINVKNDI